MFPLFCVLGNCLRNPERWFLPRRGFLGSARIAHKVADFGLNVNYYTNLSEQVVKLS